MKQVFNNESNLLLAHAGISKHNQRSYDVSRQMHFVSLTMIQLRIVDFFAPYY